MASHQTLIMLCLALISTAIVPPVHAQLCHDFYDQVCPRALPAIKAVVERAIKREPRMGAYLLRLHFHDCFVNGCDGSVLLDDTDDFQGEKMAIPNNNSARGFEVIDEIKAAVDDSCYGSVVSCADIVAVAARDSIAALGGPSYQVQLGRRDARTASKDAAENDLVGSTSNFQELRSNFNSKGLTPKDLLVLSGAHTIGFAKCQFFRENDSDIDQHYKVAVRQRCPSGTENRPAPLDGSPTRFDTGYYKNLVERKGFLHSDQQLFKSDGSESGELVKYYSENQEAFWEDFGASMIKMGNISPLTGNDGEIRKNCRKMN